MSCLTRKLHYNLTRYLKRNNQLVSSKEPAEVRALLINIGICPSSITEDQVESIIKDVS
ncbi:hypothetical protein [Aliiglaciecola sp. LCG003]|uniref:hypothetical protein n=1 Tax=Aliiglaciecola sp. LCG003 TaxID=3053655 RepID=UPI0025744211|nr:hypothetical protein [Aliiglaciecola sp. LCG003]WJG09414.1 hypothetical protein QR722_19125 [Aliiglaciecola sp. LCG003]